MHKNVAWFVVCGLAVAITALRDAPTVHATPASGFTATTLAKGTLAEFEVFNASLMAKREEAHGREPWLSLQKTKGSSDLYVQSNVWQPGGTTGWHTHPGHSLIVVTAGAVTAYDGDDVDCKPHVYTQGMGFVDPGGGHVHVIRNEGPVVAQTIAVQLIPAAASRRIDAEDPGHCQF
jgi:predicted metal-dependent enzyme (double-stranded beta helix superfamily)